nr:hypothetical protein [uncultured Azospirillum sp.]
MALNQSTHSRVANSTASSRDTLLRVIRALLLGGPGAPDDLDQAHRTQAWLAVSNDPVALVTGRYFYHMQPREVHPASRDSRLQERLIAICERLSGVKLAR